ncbi:hypothetical protein MPTK1_6g03900 [Marchantia polymorpha subsp. ruderalis]|uniref:Uncharacterized protein n=2 Tax=Marchantia polymorpha TaxID=3197 RepID=A0AAF6BNA5_MARPO|nr:hypothetical protein MARPO_0034s0128 [Marchantia polymorpha]BBN13489.1 hypothetical protein Mp_6g03900 [Marchantia polymorpha subsp. ruderalis]|eukprot:PTQ41551.1 hypothetical protein MARPO_0034s0128 [Marchantia polymorpha]
MTVGADALPIQNQSLNLCDFNLDLCMMGGWAGLGSKQNLWQNRSGLGCQRYLQFTGKLFGLWPVSCAACELTKWHEPCGECRRYSSRKERRANRRWLLHALAKGGRASCFPLQKLSLIRNHLELN